MARRKADVIAKAADNVGLTSAEAGRLINAFLDEVAGSLVRGEPVLLGAFGSFVLESPPTEAGGRAVKIKKTKVPVFRPGTRFL